MTLVVNTEQPMLPLDVDISALEQPIRERVRGNGAGGKWERWMRKGKRKEESGRGNGEGKGEEEG